MGGEDADFLAALADALCLLGRSRQWCDSARGRGCTRAIEVAAHEPQNFRRGIADVASPNAIVLHDNSLSELFSDDLRDEARDCVCPAAGSIGNDQAYWPRPIALCPREA